MKEAKRSSIFLHAAQMVLRNICSYGLLSVTIVLSFSLLLGYLSFMDAELYNQYKLVLSLPREIVMGYTYEASGKTMIEAVESKAEEIDAQLQHYKFYTCSTTLTQYGQIYAELCFLPAGNLPYYSMEWGGGHYTDLLMCTVPVPMVLGKETFSLQGNEAIINESLFYALNPEGTLPLELSIPLPQLDGGTTLFSVIVTGVCQDLASDHFVKNKDGQVSGQTHIFLSQDMMNTLSPERLGSCKQAFWMSTQYPTTMAEYALSQGFTVHSISEAQDEALLTIRTQKGTKGIIAIGLLLLLGINLYSSFSNALNDRKYEIGIKRAIGASGWAIMRQFLMESLLLMLANIILSVVLVANGLAIYKLYQQILLGKEWIIYVSMYTLLMFAVCTVALTVVFSLLFAYKSTKVEIIQYLKAE